MREHARQQARDFLRQRSPIKRCRLRCQAHDEVARAKVGMEQAKPLSDQAANQIAIDRAAQIAFGDNQSKPRCRRFRSVTSAVM